MTETALDLYKIDRKLLHSQAQRRIWSWVACLSMDESFFGTAAAQELGMFQSQAHRHLGSLEALGLIARMHGHKQPFPTPFQRVETTDWGSINELLLYGGQ